MALSSPHIEEKWMRLYIALGLKNRFSFLAFELYCGSDSKGKPRLFRRTDRERLQRARQDYKAYIKENRHMKTSVLIEKLRVKLQGHYNYFGVVGNLAGLYVVERCVTELLYKWLNRRSGRKSFTWDRLKHYLSYNPFPELVCHAKPARTKVWW